MRPNWKRNDCRRLNCLRSAGLGEAHIGFQIEIMQQAVLVVAAHGAALTNVAWQQPCSILVELFPRWLWNHGMYKGLAQDVGAVYRSVVAMDAGTMPAVNGGVDGGECVQFYIQKYGRTKLKRECTKDMDCSGCLRDQNITVDTRAVLEKLDGAWEERENCLFEHKVNS